MPRSDRPRPAKARRGSSARRCTGLATVLALTGLSVPLPALAVEPAVACAADQAGPTNLAVTGGVVGANQPVDGESDLVQLGGTSEGPCQGEASDQYEGGLDAVVGGSAALTSGDYAVVVPDGSVLSSEKDRDPNIADCSTGGAATVDDGTDATTGPGQTITNTRSSNDNKTFPGAGSEIGNVTGETGNAGSCTDTDNSGEGATPGTSTDTGHPSTGTPTTNDGTSTGNATDTCGTSTGTLATTGNTANNGCSTSGTPDANGNAANDGTTTPGTHPDAATANDGSTPGTSTDTNNTGSTDNPTTTNATDPTNPATPEATPPVITSPVEGAVLQDPSPTITGISTPGAIITVISDGRQICQSTADASGKWSCQPILPFSEAPHTITAQITDPAISGPAESRTVQFTVVAANLDPADSADPADPADDSTVDLAGGQPATSQPATVFAEPPAVPTAELPTTPIAHAGLSAAPAVPPANPAPPAPQVPLAPTTATTDHRDVVLERQAINPDESQSAAGTGWQPGESVSVDLVSSTREMHLGDVTVGDDGAYGVAFLIPEDFQLGPAILRLTGSQSGAYPVAFTIGDRPLITSGGQVAPSTNWGALAAAVAALLPTFLRPPTRRPQAIN